MQAKPTNIRFTLRTNVKSEAFEGISHSVTKRNCSIFSGCFFLYFWLKVFVSSSAKIEGVEVTKESKTSAFSIPSAKEEEEKRCERKRISQRFYEERPAIMQQFSYFYRLTFDVSGVTLDASQRVAPAPPRRAPDRVDCIHGDVGFRLQRRTLSPPALARLPNDRRRSDGSEGKGRKCKGKTGVEGEKKKETGKPKPAQGCSRRSRPSYSICPIKVVNLHKRRAK